MFRPGKSRVHILAAVAFLLGAGLLLSCQPAQPASTPKPAEKAAVTTPTTAEKAVATATKPAEKPVRGGTIRVITPLSPQGLDPQTAANNVWYLNLYDSLIENDKDQNVTKNGLFKDWTVGSDGKTITFKLREGVKFHDGTDLDAAAVKWNIERMLNPDIKSPFRSNYLSVASVEVVDNTTVRFNLKQASPILISMMGTQGGDMVSPAAVKKYGQDFPRNPVGSGPFQFVEWAEGDHVTVKRFEGYWGKDKDGNQLPYLDRVVFQIIPDATVGAAALRTGQVDVYTRFPGAQLTLIKNDPNLTYTTRPINYIYGYYLNTQKPPFSNKALRQAVALAVDREGLAAALSEEGALQASIFHPMNVEWGADPKPGLFPSRDLAKAKAKMAEGGYPSGGLVIKVPTPNDSYRLNVAEVLQANLAEIGIKVELEVLNVTAWASKAQIVANNNTAMSPGNTGVGLADPGYIFGQMFHSQGGRNYFGPYSNPQVDQLIDKAGSIYDQKERTSLYEQVAKILVDDVPYIPANVMNMVGAKNKKVRNLVQYADSYDRLKEVWLAQ